MDDFEFNVTEDWFAGVWDAPPVRTKRRLRRPTPRIPQPSANTHHPDLPTWCRQRFALAEAVKRLANRTDCTGGYRDGRPTTRKDTDWDWRPLRSLLEDHFSTGMGHTVIGLHTTSTSKQCRWIAFDIDAHNGESAEANMRTAQAIAKRLRRRGLKPYIFDSDGRGGIHIWVILERLTPSEEAYALAHKIGDGFDVECFPKQPRVREGGYGNWIRLPGPHPKRDHWSRVWTGKEWGTAEQTVDAVQRMAEEVTQ